MTPSPSPPPKQIIPKALRLTFETAPLVLFRAPLSPRPAPQTRTPLSPTRGCPAPQLQGTRAPSGTPPTPGARSAAPLGARGPGPPLSLPEKGAPRRPEDAGSAGLLLPEKTEPRQGYGIRLGARPRRPRALPVAPIGPAYRRGPRVLSAVRPGTRPGAPRLGAAAEVCTRRRRRCSGRPGPSAQPQGRRRALEAAAMPGM